MLADDQLKNDDECSIEKGEINLNRLTKKMRRQIIGAGVTFLNRD